MNAQAIVNTLLEASEDEGQDAHFRKFYEPYGAKLADKLEDRGYHLSLWHYPDADLYEVNIGHGGADWTDPATHTNPHRGQFVIPKTIINKLREWLQIRGHLVMGSHNLKRVASYKRLFQRLCGARIVDVTWPVPGGGHYFFAITTDEGVVARTRTV